MKAIKENKMVLNEQKRDTLNTYMLPRFSSQIEQTIISV